MFKKKEHLLSFEAIGYIKLPLFFENEIAKLKEIYSKHENNSNIYNKEFYTSIWSSDELYKKEVDSNLKFELEPILGRVLNDFRSIFANFMVKKPGDNSQLPPHQDWSFVDESEFYSITVWFPLIDVDKENGALEVLPKSHKLNNLIRARFLDSPFNHECDFIKANLMESVPMKAGEVLFVNSRTIHSSPPNLSNKDRIAVSIVVAPTNSTLKHYVLNKEKDAIIEMNVTPDFFTKYSCFDYPDTSLFYNNHPVNNEKYSKEKILSLILN
jgi:hypothetical protein